MTKCFGRKSQELGKQSMPQLYYFWIRQVKNSYGHEHLQTLILDFIEAFLKERIENNKLSEELRDSELTSFSYMSSQGTNNLDSIKKRSDILTKRFLEKNPTVQILDQRRLFSSDEKHVIWVRAGKKCQQCSIKLDFDDFHADHVSKYAHGGKTTLENAQALCESCNLRKG
jgi:hypothetical protein